MDKFSRSKSSREKQVQPSNMNNMRSFSTCCSSYDLKKGEDFNFDKEDQKTTVFRGDSSKNWNFNLDPELQRKKRVAGYKAYGIEGKMKGSVRKSFKWIKETCNQVVHGLW